MLSDRKPKSADDDVNRKKHETHERVESVAPAWAITRVICGGGWNNNGENCRPANRNRNTPERRNNNLGFRVAPARSTAADAARPTRPLSRPAGAPDPRAK
jgi:hypothetical protein